MRSGKRVLLIFAMTAVGLLGSAASAQEAARLHFERLNGLDAAAHDSVEVNVDGKLLELAKRVTVKINDPQARQVAQAISGLKGIYVRVYNFAKDNEYNVADVDALRSELNGPGWERLANAKSKANNQKVDVYTMFTGDKMDGVAVIVSDARSVVVVNVIGMIDIEALIELTQTGKFNIPKLDIDLGSSPKIDPPKKDKDK